MKLMTKEIEEKFEKAKLYSKEGQGFDAEVVVKYFNPYGRGTWIITEGEKQGNGDWMLFGFCHIFEWEWGYVMLSELEDIGFLERDLYIEDKAKVKDLVPREELERLYAE